MPYSDDDVGPDQPDPEGQPHPTRNEVNDYLVAQRQTTKPWFTSDEVVDHFAVPYAAAGAAIVGGALGTAKRPNVMASAVTAALLSRSETLSGMEADRAERVRQHLEALVQSRDVETVEKDGVTYYRARQRG